MEQFFIRVYRYFKHHKILLYSALTVSVLVMAFYAIQVRFDEDVTSFFPDGKDNHKTAAVFKNLKVKDKIFILFSAKDSLNADPDALIEAGQQFVGEIKKAGVSSLIKNITAEFDGNNLAQTEKYIFDNLPVILTDEDYKKLDSLTTSAAIAAKMQTNYNNLVSPIGIGLKDIILKDPIGISGSAFSGLQSFAGAATYNVYNGYIFSEDLSKMVIMIDPANGTGSTGKNEKLVSAIERCSSQIEMKNADVAVEFFGGPIMGVYNARQIKQDTMVTMTIAILIIILVISFAFRNKWAMLQITAPVLFGALFALAVIYFVNGSISAIAIGSGAAVLGIAMSYSIHVISHRSHTSSVEQVIDELAYPLTIGSFTTIGAFLGLLFTSSKLLQDFGLFAALSLVGTTIFCLVFLPHFLQEKNNEKHSRLLRWIEKVNGYRYDRNKTIVLVICILVVVCCFFFNHVKFDSNMRHINYEPTSLTKAEEKLKLVFNSTEQKVVFVSANENIDSALVDYANVYKKLERLKSEGKILNVISAQSYIVPYFIQKERIERWNRFWTAEKRKQVLELVEKEGAKYGFSKDAFNGFKELIGKSYTPKQVTVAELEKSSLFKEWANGVENLSMMLTQVSVKQESKEVVYADFKSDKNLVILDKGYYSQKMAISVRDDFNLILGISSLLIFGALLLSYGRIELALMSFIPMALSWIIILGMMALLNIEFNIVNIILSTFIFGIGDDFSIFIMDGLQQEYRTGKKMFASHKTAIFFSAFTTVIGMGALLFAEHPALKSVSTISVLGMAAVVLISYTVQPILFRLFISKPSQAGGFPYTAVNVLRTVYTYTIFVVGCIILQILSLFLLLLPFKRSVKKRYFHTLICYSTRFIIKAIFVIRSSVINEYKENFKKSAVIVANHQSFVDIIVLLSLNRKMLMVTNGWVWNSPFFGRIVRFADFYYAANGYESLADTFRERVAEGYSVVVFPEGTRSADGTINRFHKGAFFLAEQLNVDILPIVMYGNGMVISKKQPLLVNRGRVVAKILNRITPVRGEYKNISKQVRKYVEREYELLCEQYGNTSNLTIYDNIIKNYTYKGPVLEWYMRVKIGMEKRYKPFDELIPRDASVVDIGCGYGPLSFMLALVSPKRRVLGIDYDEDKIAVANNGGLKRDNLQFVYANAVEYNYPKSDVFVLNDVIHYLPEQDQKTLLGKCFANINEGGKVIVREGDKQKDSRHKLTKLSEKFSTEIIKFNKAESELCFTSTSQMESLAREYGLSLKQVDNDIYTSNTIYIFSKQ